MPVQAAGGVVARDRADGGLEVAVVHRPKYNDWSFPKGKLDPEESHERAAVREVEEETGLRCRVERPLGETTYRDNRDRQKVVRYWLMRLEDEESAATAFTPNKEVDELRWVGVSEARDLLSYPHDRELVDALSDP